MSRRTPSCVSSCFIQLGLSIDEDDADDGEEEELPDLDDGDDLDEESTMEQVD